MMDFRDSLPQIFHRQTGVASILVLKPDLKDEVSQNRIETAAIRSSDERDRLFGDLDTAENYYRLFQ